MYGLILRNEIFTFFSPVCNIAANEELLLVEKVNGDIRFMGFSQDGMWTYIAICTAIGIGLMALALLLYRRRRLECAGDFIAVKPLGPIFSVIFTLTAGCIFALFSSMFGRQQFNNGGGRNNFDPSRMQNMRQQRFAACQHIAVGCVKIAGIPRVGDAVRLLGEIEQQ